MAVYGAWIITPLGWPLAGLVWAYAVGWFLLTDPVKLLAYRVLDHFGAGDNPTVADKSQADASAAHDASAPIRPKGLNSRPKPETAPAFEANPSEPKPSRPSPPKSLHFRQGPPNDR
jgi:H+-transporting ATPase